MQRHMFLLPENVQLTTNVTTVRWRARVRLHQLPQVVRNIPDLLC